MWMREGGGSVDKGRDVSVDEGRGGEEGEDTFPPPHTLNPPQTSWVKGWLRSSIAITQPLSTHPVHT